MLSQYLSGGYYGLSIGLQAGFLPGPGSWASSYSMSVIVNRWLGFPFMYDMTYPVADRADDGWGEFKWHHALLVARLRLTYPGALIFWQWSRSLYARVWRSASTYRNPFSILLFCLLNIGLVYIPGQQPARSLAWRRLASLLVAFGLYFALRFALQFVCRNQGRSRLAAPQNRLLREGIDHRGMAADRHDGADRRREDRRIRPRRRALVGLRRGPRYRRILHRKHRAGRPLGGVLDDHRHGLHAALHGRASTLGARLLALRQQRRAALCRSIDRADDGLRGVCTADRSDHGGRPSANKSQ